MEATIQTAVLQMPYLTARAVAAEAVIPPIPIIQRVLAVTAKTDMYTLNGVKIQVAADNPARL